MKKTTAFITACILSSFIIFSATAVQSGFIPATDNLYRIWTMDHDNGGFSDAITSGVTLWLGGGKVTLSNGATLDTKAKQLFAHGKADDNKWYDITAARSTIWGASLKSVPIYEINGIRPTFDLAKGRFVDVDANDFVRVSRGKISTSRNVTSAPAFVYAVADFDRKATGNAVAFNGIPVTVRRAVSFPYFVQNVNDVYSPTGFVPSTEIPITPPDKVNPLKSLKVPLSTNSENAADKPVLTATVYLRGLARVNGSMAEADFENSTYKLEVEEKSRDFIAISYAGDNVHAKAWNGNGIYSTGSQFYPTLADLDAVAASPDLSESERQNALDILGGNGTSLVMTADNMYNGISVWGKSLNGERIARGAINLVNLQSGKKTKLNVTVGNPVIGGTASENVVRFENPVKPEGNSRQELTFKLSDYTVNAAGAGTTTTDLPKFVIIDEDVGTLQSGQQGNPLQKAKAIPATQIFDNFGKTSFAAPRTANNLLKVNYIRSDGSDNGSAVITLSEHYNIPAAGFNAAEDTARLENYTLMCIYNSDNIDYTSSAVKAEDIPGVILIPFAVAGTEAAS